MARAPLLDAAGRPVPLFSIVEVRYRGTWRRGRVTWLGRKRLVVELYLLRRPGLRTSYRRPGQVYVVRG